MRLSQPAPLHTPISFAFRLRRLLGIGVRAEIVRALLTIRAPRLSSRVIAASAGFAQRNVREGLSQLYEAGVLTVVEVADDRQYAINADHWAALLELQATPYLPFHYDWIPAFRALMTILRWLDQPGLDELSDYIRASQARTLLDTIEADLRYVGVPAHLYRGVGSDQWDDFVNVARLAARHVITRQ
jgi:DNA-binding transcriptional ArsR family regulator